MALGCAEGPNGKSLGLKGLARIISISVHCQDSLIILEIRIIIMRGLPQVLTESSMLGRFSEHRNRVVRLATRGQLRLWGATFKALDTLYQT